MKKMLMIASVASMIDQFNMNNIQTLQEMNYEVHVAANFQHGNTSSILRLEKFQKELTDRNVVFHQIDFSRNVLNVGANYKAFKQVRTLFEMNDFELVHCHSPVGGVCGRLAARSKYTKVIYTAHGFHFYKGAPFINWFLFYPVEKWLSRKTDVLITINKEDYKIAQSFHAKKTICIPGIGINTDKYLNGVYKREEIRKELDIPQDAFVLLSVGELSKRKNHRVVIEAISELKQSNIIYVLCGIGLLEDELKKLVEKYGIDVRFLGYREDVLRIYTGADVFVFPSLQEGLPVALMEAMAAGLPIICSAIRGNQDLVEDCEGGFLVDPNDKLAFSERVQDLLHDYELCEKMSKYNQRAVRLCDEKVVKKLMKEIYESVVI
jgi:glycosyltransferase involved in cell wall biosynthesis